ncbi:hypothetical protein GCM10025859_37280 [Alicyclobacillus fastidiosus]|nr:biotin transporter BioY [Alicyclobacillus fastidiosus]GMA63288.1 hypothetical protein GCM10025859_37280 [Alicyclobacillus fastidiosus]
MVRSANVSHRHRFRSAGPPLIRGNAGIGLLVGATAGYIWSWPILAWLTGYFVGKIRPRTRSEYWLLLIVLFICGDLISYVPGVLWLRHVVPAVRPWGKAMMAGAIPFLPGDFAKALVASAIVLIVRRVYPQERIIRGQQFVSQSLEQGAGRGD